MLDLPPDKFVCGGSLEWKLITKGLKYNTFLVNLFNFRITPV